MVNKLADKAAGVATDLVERRALGRGKSVESKARAEHGVGEPARSEVGADTEQNCRHIPEAGTLAGICGTARGRRATDGLPRHDFIDSSRGSEEHTLRTSLTRPPPCVTMKRQYMSLAKDFARKNDLTWREYACSFAKKGFFRLMFSPSYLTVKTISKFEEHIVSGQGG